MTPKPLLEDFMVWSNALFERGGRFVTAVALVVAVFSLAVAFGGAPGQAHAEGAAKQLKAGTYTVTANVGLSAGDAKAAGFGVLAGIAGADGSAYMTNPDNPVGIGGHNGVPTSPVSDNAVLEVGDDGLLSLTVPIANPVFTMQDAGSCGAFTSMSATTVSGSFGKYDSRIDSLVIGLPDVQTTSYTLSGAAFHPTILADQYPKAITVPMTLTLDLSGVPEAEEDVDDGDSTGSGDSPDPSDSGESPEPSDPGESSGPSDSGDSPGANDPVESGGSSGAVEPSGGSGSPAGSASTGGLAAGTYRVTANLSMMTPLGIVAYATNPDNPLGLGSGAMGVPNAPMKDNAVLTVSANGTYQVKLDLANPVFTIQKLGSGNGAKLVSKKTKTLEYVDAAYKKEVNKAGYSTRICEAVYSISKASGSWKITGCKQYATALRDAKEYSYGKLALDMTLVVDSSSAKAISAEEAKTVGASSGSKSSSGKSGASDADAVAKALAKANKSKGSKSGSNAAPSGAVATTSDGKVKQGTYTVSANIWVNKATSGLPLQPHFTSAAFPPMNPVENNAILTADADGKCSVKVPILIQSRVMLVRKITGLDLVDSKSSGGGLSSVTVNLGVLSASDSTVTKQCTASVELGSLASTIIGGAKNRTWQATFEMNFKGKPESGGGEVPEAAQKLMEGAGADGRASDADAAAEAAADSALAGLGEKSTNGKVYELAEAENAATSGAAQSSVPWVAIAIAAGVVCAAGAGFVFGRKGWEALPFADKLPWTKRATTATDDDSPDE